MTRLWEEIYAMSGQLKKSVDISANIPLLKPINDNIKTIMVLMTRALWKGNLIFDTL